MNKKEQVRRLGNLVETLVKEGSIMLDSSDKFDLEAEVDETLEYRENKKNILDMLHYKGDVREQDYAEERDEYFREIQRQRAEKESKIDLDNDDSCYDLLKSYTRMVGLGYATSLMVCGPGGTGKTYQVLAELERTGVDYVYINSYSTPLSLYVMLYTNKDKVIVLDDFEGILNSRTGVSILKAALWSADGPRVVHYNSTSDKLIVPSSFEFNGRIIFCFNTVGDNEELKALKSRTLFYELKLGLNDLKKVFLKIAEEPNAEGLSSEEQREVAHYLIGKMDLSTSELNLRTLIKAYWGYKYCKEHGGCWKELADMLVVPDDSKKILIELDYRYPADVKAQVREYMLNTGRSRASFYRMRKELGLSRSYSYH